MNLAKGKRLATFWSAKVEEEKEKAEAEVKMAEAKSYQVILVRSQIQTQWDVSKRQFLLYSLWSHGMVQNQAKVEAAQDEAHGSHFGETVVLKMSRTMYAMSRKRVRRQRSFAI